MKSGSLKPPISTRISDLESGGRNDNELIDNDTNKKIGDNPILFGINNRMVPQNSDKLCSDSWPYHKISSDEQNDDMDWKSSSSYNLKNNSERSMKREVLIGLKTGNYDDKNAKMLLEPFDQIKSKMAGTRIHYEEEIDDMIMDDKEVIDLTKGNSFERHLESRDESQDKLSFILNTAPTLHHIH